MSLSLAGIKQSLGAHTVWPVNRIEHRQDCFGTGLLTLGEPIIAQALLAMVCAPDPVCARQDPGHVLALPAPAQCQDASWQPPISPKPRKQTSFLKLRLDQNVCLRQGTQIQITCALRRLFSLPHLTNQGIHKTQADKTAPRHINNCGSGCGMARSLSSSIASGAMEPAGSSSSTASGAMEPAGSSSSTASGAVELAVCWPEQPLTPAWR